MPKLESISKKIPEAQLRRAQARDVRPPRPDRLLSHHSHHILSARLRKFIVLTNQMPDNNVIALVMIVVDLRQQKCRKISIQTINYSYQNDMKAEDDKTAYYYNIQEGILKVVDEHSTGRAKLSLKLGNEFTGFGMEEHEVYLLNCEQSPHCRRMLDQLGHNLKATIEQKRVNFRYNGVDIALKHTPSWGFHFEVEVLVRSRNDVPRARMVIDRVCHDLGIAPLNEKELKNFIAHLESE